MVFGDGILSMFKVTRTKLVYVGMCADLIHHGHLNIIKEAQKYGKVIVGLLTDSAIASYKRLPALGYDERKIVVENIVGVHKVIPQTTLDYIPNIEKLKPNYVVHGDDWKEGVQKQVRQGVIDKLKDSNIVCSPSAIHGLNSDSNDLFNLNRIMPGFMNTPFPFDKFERK